ncbi:hypothetical protein EVAR_96954_1 [Eumeta japonica]|uniref:Uncharacterized protein n=1 Tax=Eumeta variegata TaxID=151549 RepID=A0A4C1VDN2_EUMVA|nr:hypothetical protein EVAR_96954_1 [Eumeta japonica]
MDSWFLILKYDQNGGILRKGQFLSTRKRRACTRRLMKVGETQRGFLTTPPPRHTLSRCFTLFGASLAQCGSRAADDRRRRRDGKVHDRLFNMISDTRNE